MSGNEQVKHRTFPNSVQPGIPRLKKVREGCQRTKFGKHLFEERRPVELALDQDYELVTVKRSRGGVIKRQTMKGRNISVQSQFRLKQGDFLMSKRQIVHGACGLVPKELEGSIVSNEYAVVRVKPTLDAEYLNYLSHTIYFQQTCFHSSIGVHVEKMIFKLDDWFNWPFDLPSLPEQKKIAAFLGAVDEKLDGLRRKRELLTDYKRGVMQQIFSQKLRFKKPDDTDFPDWEEKRLGVVFEWIKTNSLSRENLTYDHGSVQNIHYGDIHTKFKPLFIQAQERVPYVLPSVMLKGFSDVEFCRIGDVVIADASEDYADVGKAIEIVAVKEGSLVAGLHTFIARPKDDSLVVGYSGYAFRTQNLRKQIMRIAQGISVLGVSKTNLSKLHLVVPHPDEQQKIADCLSALDAKIDAVAAQIAQMEAFKKGLLQQMFV